MNQLRIRFRRSNAQVPRPYRVDLIGPVPLALTGVHRRMRRTVYDRIRLYLPCKIHDLINTRNIKLPHIRIDKLVGIISCIQLIHSTPKLSVASRYNDLLHRPLFPPSTHTISENF